MAILCAVVARGTTVLSEFSAVTGNASAVARRILDKLPEEANSRVASLKIAIFFTFLGLMASLFFVWPTTPSAV